MRTAQICPTCSTFENALCILYSGDPLNNINVNTLDNLNTVIENINNNLVPVHGAGDPTNSAIYLGQLYLNTADSTLYIADAVGGGSADWIEIYTSENPQPITGYTGTVSAGSQTLTFTNGLLISVV
jgi:hypothetical protein